MKVLHVPFNYFPDAPGGTELYVAALAREQKAAGLEPVIAAAAASHAEYAHDGVPVHRFAVSDRLSLSEQWGDGDPIAAAGFERIIDTVRPDLIHLHSRTPAVSARVTRLVSQRGIPIVFTYHTATSSCPRGTLRRWGSVTCDGLLLDHRCSACVIAAHGAPRSAAIVIEPLARFAAKAVPGKAGGLYTGVRLPELVSQFKRATLEFLNSARQVVVMAAWSQRVLEINGIPAERITVIPHGLLTPFEAPAASASAGPIRLGFFGRLDPTKGLHLVIEAMARQPELNITLTVYAIRQTGDSDHYARSIMRRGALDARIRFRDPVAHDGMSAALSEVDAIVVPSILLETGPLVVLESFAARRPVIGTRLGGIADKVSHEVDGLLVEPNIDSWISALARAGQEQGLLSKLRDGIRPQRTMRSVSLEVQQVYNRVAG